MKLEKDQSIISIRVNVDLDGYKDDKYPERTYTSDFVCVKDTGDLMVRECIERKLLQKPMTIRLLDGSREYWKTHGVSDWGLLLMKNKLYKYKDTIVRVLKESDQSVFIIDCLKPNAVYSA